MVQATIEALLKTKIGFNVNSIGETKLNRAIEIRSFACGECDVKSYLQILQSSPQELEELIENILVQETWFFRDRESFNFLHHYVKSEWLPSLERKKLKVLSIPCSTGEEPYSIAMSLVQAGLTTEQFCIDAVDISKKALEQAKQAIYGKNSFRGKELNYRDKYFQSTPKGYKLIDFIKKTVNFRQGNILNANFLKNNKYDIIYCKNLLIYLEPLARSNVIEFLNKLLNVNGILFVGSAETTQLKTQEIELVRHPFAFAHRKVKRTQEQKDEKIIPFRNNLESKQLLLVRQGGKELTTAPQLKVFPTKLKPSSLQGPEFVIQNSVKLTAKTSEKCLFKEARELADRGELDEAIHLTKTYLNQNRTSAPAYLLLGEIHQVQGKEKEAEEFFQKALYLQPNYYEALMHLTLLKERQGHSAQASVLWQRIKRLQLQTQ